ncbi:AraC family transcriptional regulator [Luteolibacter arcticus]|uniref:AraC family transcriptional regulator n=1 Tax=Luteolibacter arcticus TaxID=1581411 RepID=A0ABT3GQX5_9BACT|nr:AraC family transcriptional regulator [Luteolibacter arcticus]MCW1925905.1 AraC family transcriptional regulator [Luteolibacter arcticus]
MARRSLHSKAADDRSSPRAAAPRPSVTAFTQDHVLSRHAESLAIIEEGSEPAAIAKARRFIHAHLDDSLTLGTVAREAGLSESHFCRLFNEATGLTLTGYVNRCRVEAAKCEILKPGKRVSEIAFEVGYQSLSQFNRCFASITGTSPTLRRKEKFAGA